MDPKVLIGVITGEYGRRADFYDYYNLLHKPPNTIVAFCHDRSPAKGRNLIIEQALKLDCSHILFIDDDMQYEPNALELLLENGDRDVISGLYLSRAYPHQPLIFDVADIDGACLPAYLTDDEQRLKKIVASGFGFCLINIRVFKILEKPWVRLGELNNEEWCDDIGFFNRFREAGLQAYCDMNCLLGHIGTMIVKPVKHDNAWFTVYDTGGTGAIQTPQVAPKLVMK